MTTLKQCLDQTNWAAVQESIQDYFPEAVPLLDALQIAYRELLTTTAVDQDLWLTIGEFPPNGPLRFYVRGFYAGAPRGRCLKFIDWSHWLGALIDARNVEFYSKAQLVAIALYEMCWAGISSDEVTQITIGLDGNEPLLMAIFTHDDLIADSEPNLIKRRQRQNEFNQALNLLEFDDPVLPRNASERCRQEYQALFDQIYLLGETETDWQRYEIQVKQLRKQFERSWCNKQTFQPD